MRTMLRLLSAVLLTLSLTAKAHAATVPAALNGSLYAIIEAAADGSGGPVASYIRFFNGAVAASTFNVLIIGSQSGDAYGQAVTLKIPQNASVQYSLGQLLSLAGSARGAGVPNGDSSFSVYIQDPDAATGYQHVTYNAASQFLENASVCDNGLLPAAVLASSNSVAVTNVHTSLLTGFPSAIAFHNYSKATASYKLVIVDAGALANDGSTISTGAGAAVGQTTLSIPGNSTVSKLFTDLQTAVNWQPSSTQTYANIIVTDPNGGVPAILADHTITINALGSSINMSTTCAVNTLASSSLYKGSIAGVGMQSGTLAANVAASSSSSGAISQSTIAKSQAVERAQAVSQTSAQLLLSGGASVTLTGTYDSSTNAVNLSGSGYTFTGTASAGVYSGTYTGPNNATGAFSTLSAAQGAVTAYCGTYTENNGAGTGVFNIQISASGVASGETAPTSGDTEPGTFTGQASGSVVNVVHHSADGNPLNDTYVTANVQNGTVSGSFPTGAGGVGTFSGGTCALPAS